LKLQSFLRNTLIIGTIILMAVFIALTVDTLRQVTSTRTAELTDQVVAGKRDWQFKNCQDCHTLYGIGGYWAPELTKEASRRDASFMDSWIADPQAVKPGTTMPNQRLSSQQVLDLVAFLQWVDKTNTNNWPPAPLVFTTPSSTGLSGPLLFQQLGCNSCHMINGQGSSGPGPNLSKIGSQPYDSLSNSADFLDKWLQNPRAQKPSTSMPAISMTDAQRQALVQYLTGLK
jgi:nitric oxide reductase subunit C